EVAAEAEHVGPGAQAEVFEVLARTERPGGADEPAGVVADVELGECGEDSQRPGRSPRRRRVTLGGRLGEVRGDGPLGQLLAVVEGGRADGADVELTAEGEGVGAAVALRSIDACGGDSGMDGVGQQLGGRPGRRGRVAALWAVE